MRKGAIQVSPAPRLCRFDIRRACSSIGSGFMVGAHPRRRNDGARYLSHGYGGPDIEAGAAGIYGIYKANKISVDAIALVKLRYFRSRASISNPSWFEYRG